MGVDYFGVRSCSLYRSLGVAEAITLIKASLQLEGLEERRSQLEAVVGSSLDAMPIRVSGADSSQQITSVSRLRAQIERFPRGGIPECVQCPISGGRGLGCYRYVHHPIDRQFEQHLFSYFVTMLGEDVADYFAAAGANGVELTAGRLLHELVVSEVDSETPWETRRGSLRVDALASLEAPLRARLPDGSVISSARVLHAAFHPIDGPASLQLYAWFFRDFYRWLAAEGLHNDASRTLGEVRHAADLLIRAVQALQTGTEEVQVIVMA